MLSGYTRDFIVVGRAALQVNQEDSGLSQIVGGAGTQFEGVDS